MEKEEFLTVEEAAARLKLSVFTMRDYLRAGKVPGIKVGKFWRVPESALAAMGSRVKLMPACFASPDATDAELLEGLERFAVMQKANGVTDKEIANYRNRIAAIKKSEKEKTAR
jgi:excisionase family DNA binding protein